MLFGLSGINENPDCVYSRKNCEEVICPAGDVLVSHGAGCYNVGVEFTLSTRPVRVLVSM